MAAPTRTHPTPSKRETLCAFSAETTCAETPLTSEPPLPAAEPLHSEPPLPAAEPLYSEPPLAAAEPLTSEPPLAAADSDGTRP
ncbi:hypothetical protein [Streptomyces sp. NPDC001315]|uniref:hypothetical protein n=1 Tax=Streptomyces sp. NPDC001315 TaxID=3364562 RepID=UPI0036CF230B